MSAPPLADLPKNTMVRVIERSRVMKENGKSGYWSKVEIERGSDIITGWVYDGYLSSQEIKSSAKGLTHETIMRDDGSPIGRITGRFMLVECDYNPGYSANPYFFLGSQKQYFTFNEDNSCSLDINVCSGSSVEEGTYTQEGRAITVTMGRERIAIEILGNNALRITNGSGALTCHVCRGVVLARTSE